MMDRIKRIQKLAKTDPAQARQFLKDPDNAAYALFYRGLAGMTKTLNRIDQANVIARTPGPFNTLFISAGAMRFRKG